KGVPFSAAVAYLIAGPIVNPVTFASTGMAYLWDWKIAVIRLLCGYGIGVLLSLIAGKLYPGKSALNYKFLDNNEHPSSCSCHNCNHYDHHHEKQPLSKRAVQAVNHAIDDFLGVGQYLIIGAFAAALAHTLIPADTFVKLSNSPEISIVLMMGLAGVLNLCSEADAFVAASFRYILPLASQMAFMVFGAMWDLKLAALYMSFVKKGAFIVLSILIILSVLTTMIILHHSMAVSV
ncbi:MAG: hypothetical protein GF307_10025, partial [candidate division Zixibacteria bacterium]|nr:hypothetical protein [candidate division Zixibacteria bacterium]